MRRVLIGLVATIIVVLALAVVFRATLLELALHQTLRAAGFPNAELTVAEINLNVAELANIRLGDDIQIGRIALYYQPAEIIRLKSRRLVVEALTLDFTAGESKGIGVIRQFAAEPGSDTARQLTLPPIEFLNASIRWPSPLGTVDVVANGKFVAGNDGSLKAEGSFAARANAGSWLAHLTLERSAGGILTGYLDKGRGDLQLGQFTLQNVVTELNFEVRDDRLQHLKARLKLPKIISDNHLVGSIDLDIEGARDRFQASTEGQILGVPFQAKLDGELDLVKEQLRLISITASTKLEHDAPLLAAVELAIADSGRADLLLKARDATLPFHVIPSTAHEAFQYLIQSGTQGTLELKLEDVAIAGKIEALAAMVRSRFETSPETLQFDLVGPVVLNAGQLAPELLVAAGIPPDLAQQLVGPLALTFADPGATSRTLSLTWDTSPHLELSGLYPIDLTMSDRLSFRGQVDTGMSLYPEVVLKRANITNYEIAGKDLTLAGQKIATLAIDGSATKTNAGWRAKAGLDLRLRAPRYGGWRARGASIQLPLQLTLESKNLTLWLAKSGTLNLARVVSPIGIELPPRLAIRISPQKKPLFETTLGDAFEASATLAAAPIKPFEIRYMAGTEPLSIHVAALPMRLSARLTDQGVEAVDIRIKGAKGNLPQFQTQADSVSAHIHLGKKARTGRLTYRIGKLVSNYADLHLAPVVVAGDANLLRDRIEFTASLNDLQERIRMNARGHYEYRGQILTADIALPPISFLAGSLQPRDLLPQAAVLGTVDGSLSGSASVSWSGAGFKSSGVIDLENISVKSDELAIQGLTGRLALANLWPPEIRSPQRIKIAAVKGPISISNIEAALTLSSAAGRPFGIIRLEEAVGDMDFGRITLNGATLEPADNSYYLPIRLDRLSLATLFDQTGVEGLTGTGTLSGAVLIKFVDGRLAIEEGTLTAGGPGTIRFTSEAAKRALASGGEQVALLLQALENFQYDALTIGLDKPADGNATAKLSIRGKNPDVLDGYPFALNIDLSGDFDTLLGTVLEAYHLSDQALRATVQ